MKKSLLFWALYIYSWFTHLKVKQSPPVGLTGQRVFMFFDPQHPGKYHGVVAFILPYGTAPDQLSDDLFGPFGYCSQIDRGGTHLYGRDTWGTVDAKQIAFNAPLYEIAQANKGHTILLAGVRNFLGRHPRPLNDPDKFILSWKE